ncbi:MAG: hypothetical protein AB7O66_08185 [Limisphaerales bacterium]
MPTERQPAGNRAGVGLEKREAFRVVFLLIGLLVLPASLTLRTILEPGKLVLESQDPTPLGYTWSLLLFLVPLAALGIWFVRRRDLVLARKAFWRTIAVLSPLGVGLDLLFGNAFFTFPNHASTLGIEIPAVGGPIPIEEFVFYVTGFMLVLLSYVWADEYWLSAYNVPDYRSEVREVRRIAQFHGASVILGASLIVAATVYKKLFSGSPEGFPWYLTYLTALSFVPSAGFFRTAGPFINWRAFAFTFFLILLISLLWEATLAIPYGWWGYRPAAMTGWFIRAWHGLPVEAVCVWLAVTFTTVIVYEVIKIWQALGTGAWEAFFGSKATQ